MQPSKYRKGLRKAAAAAVFFALVSVSPSALFAASPEEETKPTWNLSFGYTSDYWRTLDGGLDTGDVFIGLGELVVDWEKASSGLRSKLHLIHTDGNSFSELVGDTHVISNIEADRATRVIEAWVEYAPSSDDRSIKFGLYDLNTEFDVSEVAGTLINSTFGIGIDFAQSGLSGPSIFPHTGLALRGRWRLGPRWLLQGVVIDGNPADTHSPRKFASVHIDSDEGLLLVGELEYRTDSWRTVVGHWRYSAKFDEFSGIADGSSRQSRRNSGTYGFVEGPIRQFDDRRLLAVLRLGTANPKFNIISSTIQAAMVLERPWLRREGESLSMGVAHARNGGPARRLAAVNGRVMLIHETVVELAWRVPISERIVLQPDLQFVLNPGAVDHGDNVWAGGVRIEVDLSPR